MSQTTGGRASGGALAPVGVINEGGEPTDTTKPAATQIVAPSKPATHQADLRNLHPAIVKRLVPLPNWVNWRWQLNEKREGWTKVPYQPQTPSRKAKSNDKTTWGMYADAVANVEAGKADGIGFMLFETNVCAFDLDNCRDDATGQIDPVATTYLERCGVTYFEETVGGRGLRCIGLGGTKKIHRRQTIVGSAVSIESYRNCERFITISGKVLDRVKPNMADLGNIDAVLTAVVEELDRETESRVRTTNSDGGGQDGHNMTMTDAATNRECNTSSADAFTEASLPNDLLTLIRDSVPITEDRSAAFYHVIKWLKDKGWTIGDTVTLLARYPNGIALKYGKRLAAEVERAFNKLDKAKPGSIGSDSNSDNALPFYGVIAEEFFRKLDARGEDLKIVADEKGNEHIWMYRDGLWSLVMNTTPWLDHQIEMTLRDLKKSASSGAKFVMEARKYIERSPNIRTSDHIVWDNHGMVPTRSGLIDPLTLAIRPLRKEDYATWYLDIVYDPAATCPLFLEFLDDYFIDHSKDESSKRISLLQEFMGTTLIDRMPKSLRRALVFHGPSDSGKTELLQIMSGLLTDKPISTSFSDLNGSHGIQEFIRRAPWVLHEAFNAGQWHFSNLVKSIISGDFVSINPKNKDAITMRMRAPCIWATNHPPQFKENTDAIVNRLLILTLSRIFIKGVFIGVSAKAREINPAWEASDLILDREKPGLLNWALIGLQRILKRGNFINTDEGEAALDEVREDGNPVVGFVQDCISFDPDLMVSTRDFHAAFTGWRLDNHSDEKTNFSRDAVGKHLKALAHPKIAQNKKKFREENGTRYYLGITLNREGRAYFDMINDEQVRSGIVKLTGLSGSADKTRRMIPEKWWHHPEVEKLKKSAERKPEENDRAPKF